MRSAILLVEVIQYLTQHAEWVKIPFLDTAQLAIHRATNRVFVTVPVCLLILYIHTVGH